MTTSLRQRVLTAVIAAVALLLVLFCLPAVAMVAVVTALVLAGAWEWAGFAGLRGLTARGAYVGAIALLLWAFWQGFAGPRLPLMLSAAVAWWLAALAWVAVAPRRVTPLSAALAGAAALVPAWLVLVYLRLRVPHGIQWLLFTLLLVWLADIGAYFAGHRFGRVRLAPQVSPGKTWEGVLGAALITVPVAVAGGAWFGLPLRFFLPLCLAAVAFSIVGDLTESMLKRYAGLKDSGSLFPGHGGVMDRIDSITAAAPVLALGLAGLGVLS
ncbi:MAG: phosphatidate cytidylyltransferase [Proteobacteria bacterium]|nr:phosphatidate cytidylyltransferase [Pseudomonadota bacterium]